MFEFLKNNLLKPDLILLSGDYSRKLLLAKEQNINHLIIGSSKVYKIKNKKINNICLVIPEGDLVEINIFLEFIKNYSSKYNDMDFIFQMPPHLSNLKPKLEKIYKQYPNIKISKPSLDENISKSKYVLYRGSSAVFNCIFNYCLPIHLKNDHFDELPFNVSKDQKLEHFQISKINELNKIFKKKINLKNNRNFIRSIFYPFDEKKVNTL